MLTKEELVNTYIKYSSDITEEIFDKIIDKLESLGFKKYSDGSRDLEYKYFVVKNFSYLKIDGKYWFVGSFEVDYKEIQVSDILREESKFEVGKYYCYNWDWRDSGKFICKIKKVSDTHIRPEWEYSIKNNEFDASAQDFTVSLSEISEVKELNQEEVQQYLPDNHPDKVVKPIKKWSVGTYVVFCKEDLRRNIGDIDKIVPNKTSDRNFITLEKYGFYNIGVEEVKWFATLSEAKAFSKSLLESKPLSVDDLVEGEIYYWEARESDHDWWIRKCSNSGTNRSNLKISQDYFDATYGTVDSNLYIISKATAEQIKHLKVCEKQNKFIPQDQLDMYDSEGNLIEDKPKFKVGDWVVVIPSNNNFPNYDNAIGHIFPIRGNGSYYQNFIKGEEEAIDPNNTYGINYKLEDVRLATPEEIAKVTKPKPKPFEFNKWYKRIEPRYSKILIFVYENGYYENRYYGFNLDGKWFNSSHFDYSEFDKERLIPATIEEVKERLLSYAKEKYPIGTKFKCIAYDKEFTVTNPNYMDNASGFTPNDDSTIWIGVKEQCSGRIFGNKGKWAEVISKPESKESKEFDRKWYVEVSSQEEADKVFEYLESIGESVVSDRKYIPKKDYKYIYYLTGAEKWFLGTNPRNYPQKQLSDILPEYRQPIKTGSGLKEQIAPNYSKVNRNVYYEVSNQEEYEEILDWLKSMGEKVCTSSIVTKDWKYIYRDNNWCLDRVKPDLPKAEFPFKSKQSIKVDTYFEEACPFPSFGDFSVDLSDVTISEQVICPTIKETPTNEKEIISKIKKSIEF